MNELIGKKFVASYSGGKDSMLALYRAIKSGLSPLELMTMYNDDVGRSFCHGFSTHVMEKVAEALALPITLCKTSGELYEENFEKALDEAKKRGAQVCVFGDIDIPSHQEWCNSRCEKVGLIPYFPLWQESRKKLVGDFINAGFLSLITVVDTSRMPKTFLGQILSNEVANAIEESGADICGENGEYHTFVFDGPLFKRKVEFSIKESVVRDKYAMLDLV